MDQAQTHRAGADPGGRPLALPVAPPATNPTVHPAKDSAAHLFVDISAHGFGHLAQAAPILNALQRQRPDLRLTLRSALPQARLKSRIDGAFTHIAAASDFGFAMHDALNIDLPATLRRYRRQHADWARRVDAEARFLDTLRPDLVLTDVAYLPLAGAARAGIPAWSMCSLNWADLFAHFFVDRKDGDHGQDAAARCTREERCKIHGEILAAYRSAAFFLRLTPAMPMRDFGNARAIAPVAALGTPRRAELAEKLALAPDECLALITYGGFDHDLGAARWPPLPGIRWLVPQSWQIRRPDMTALESLLSPGFTFSDLLASADALLAKPGYGTFVEAACNGISVLYQRRGDWPEQDCLIDWLEQNGCCREIAPEALARGDLRGSLEALWQQAQEAADAPRPRPDGIAEAAELLSAQLMR
mgnify:CR=1 FL=1